MGKYYLFGCFLTMYIVTDLVATKVASIFGYNFSMGAIFFAALFLATDLLSEHYGKKEAIKVINLGLVSILSFLVLSQSSLLILPIDSSLSIHTSLQIIFSSFSRITIASLLAYSVGNYSDIFIFDLIDKKFTGKKWLWLRNNGSTFCSQFLNTLTFFPIAFYGTMPKSLLLEIAIVGHCVKLTVAILDTPFVYFSYYFLPKELKDKKVN